MLQRLFSLLAAVHQASPDRFPDAIEALIPALVKLVVEETDPRLKVVPGLGRKLEPSVRRTLAYMIQAGTLIPRTAVPLGPAEWSTVPEVNAIFSGREDVSRVIGNSETLRQWFASHPIADQVFAWLGAERNEKRVLGVELSGETLLQDVPQVAVSFASPQVAFPAGSVDEARVELAMAVFRGLLGIAMERIEATRSRVKDLGELKAMLQVRLRRLRSRAGAVDSLAGDQGRVALEIREAEDALEKASKDLADTRSGALGLEGWLSEIQAVLDRPGDVMDVCVVPIRVNRMGIRVDANCPGPLNEFSVVEIRHAPAFSRVVVMVRVSRKDMLAQ